MSPSDFSPGHRDSLPRNSSEIRRNYKTSLKSQQYETESVGYITQPWPPHWSVVRTTGVSESNGTRDIGADQVAGHQVVRPRMIHRHARQEVARDQVPRWCPGSRRVRRWRCGCARVEEHTTVGVESGCRGVAQCDRPGHIGSDVVALDEVVVGADDLHAGQDVGGDDVAGGGRGAADDVPRGTRVDRYAVAAVAQRGRARLIGADEIARDQVARRRRAADRDASRGVCRDHVPGAGGGAADRVAQAPLSMNTPLLLLPRRMCP